MAIDSITSNVLSPRYADLYASQGTDFYLNMIVKFDNNIIKDISSVNYTLTGKIKKTYFSTETPIFFEVTIDTDSSPYTGIFTLHLSAEQTAAMTAGRYVYEVILSDGSSSPSILTKILYGKLEIYPSVN